MKISEHFNLGKSQYELDFVDIDTDEDIPLFLDPYYISKCDFPFAQKAYASIRSYFEYLLALLRAENYEKAEDIFSYLGETNDICFGLSEGKPRGHGMGPSDTPRIFANLIKSGAVKTGYMEDIEDFRLFVPNVDKDKVSDMTANIIKKHLLDYTEEQCKLNNITLMDDIPSGYYWSAETRRWENRYVRRLVVDEHPILLVPKRIASYKVLYVPSEYKQHFVLNFLQEEHMSSHTGLVRQYNDGVEYVTKKDIEYAEGKMDKAYLLRFTEAHPEVFKNFKEKVIQNYNPLSGNVLEEIQLEDVCTYLAGSLRKIRPGRDEASAYHNLMIGILELLFYPNLSTPIKEAEINEGRKRIDIAFNNTAQKDFFYTLPNSSKLPCSNILVECKNYSREIANPELDQMAGRFSPNRGRVGIVVCRNIDNQELFLQRCSDTLRDDRGLIIPLTDVDIIQALEQFPTRQNKAIESILEERYHNISLR